MTAPHPELLSLVVADGADAWRAAGFAVTDDRLVVDGAEIVLDPSSGSKGIAAWSLSEVAPGTVDGLTTLAPSDGPRDEPDAHPNGVTAIDHVVVGSPDLPRTVAALEAVGIEERRTRDTEQQGAPMRQVFFRIGRPILELIGPPEPSGDGPCRFWGLALTVADLDATRELLGEALSDPKPAVQPGRRIATVRRPTPTQGPPAPTVPLAFMTPPP